LEAAVLVNYRLFALNARVWTSVGWTTSILDALPADAARRLQETPGLSAKELAALLPEARRTVHGWGFSSKEPRSLPWLRIFELMPAAFPGDRFCIWHTGDERCLARCKGTYSGYAKEAKDSCREAYLNAGVDKSDIWTFGEWNPKIEDLYSDGSQEDDRGQQEQQQSASANSDAKRSA